MRKPLIALLGAVLTALPATAVPVPAAAGAGGTAPARAALAPSPVPDAAGVSDLALRHAREMAAKGCGALRTIHLPGGRWNCTHGPDPKPAFRQRPPQGTTSGPGTGRVRTGLLFPDPSSGQQTAAAGPATQRCYGDGTDGDRVEAIYAYPSQDPLNPANPNPNPDRYQSMVPHIQQWAEEADAAFNASAAQVGGYVRHIRWQTDPASCTVTVDHVVLDPAGVVNLDGTEAELAAQGFTNPSRKYVVWVDAPTGDGPGTGTGICGIASYYVDDSPGPSNFNNGNPQAAPTVSRIDAGCWGLADPSNTGTPNDNPGYVGYSIEAHEIMHAMGSVMPSAPGSTTFGHCSINDDRMCYNDGSPNYKPVMICQAPQDPSAAALFDCAKNLTTGPEAGGLYFNPAVPAPGSGGAGATTAGAKTAATAAYLPTHWNTADNAFLASLEGDVPVGVGPASSFEGSHTIDFPVTVATIVNQPTTVNFTTQDGTAQAGVGYQATSGTVTIPPYQATAYIRVPLIPTANVMPDTTFSVTLGNPCLGCVITNPSAVGTILNDNPKHQGYVFVAADGGIFNYGQVGFYGSTGSMHLNQPVVGMALTPSGNGYWLVASDGGIFTFGDAGFHGSTGAIKLARPIVGMAATPDGGGYWLVASDGGVFAFGDANASLGSAAGQGSAPVVAIAPTADGQGYWIVASDGTIYNKGDAPAFGPAPVNGQRIAAAAATDGVGLWLASNTGSVFTFGDAQYHGGMTGALNKPIVGMARTPKGEGYWLTGSDGGIFSFGDANFYGSTGAIKLNQPIVGLTSRVHF